MRRNKFDGNARMRNSQSKVGKANHSASVNKCEQELKESGGQTKHQPDEIVCLEKRMLYLLRLNKEGYNSAHAKQDGGIEVLEALIAKMAHHPEGHTCVVGLLAAQALTAVLLDIAKDAKAQEN